MSLFGKLSRKKNKKDKMSENGNMSIEQLNDTLFDLAMQLYNDGNYEMAFRQMKIVAEEGGARDAMFNLGIFYMRGIGTSENIDLGLEWLKKAALAGDEKAAYNVAIAYHDGRDVARNYTEAKKWYEIAARLGDEKAKKELDFFAPGSIYHLYGRDTFANEVFLIDTFTNLKDAEQALTKRMNKAGRPSPDRSKHDPGVDLRDYYWLVRE